MALGVLPSAQVAVALLVMFFLYDIFMVFLSPLLFNSSVMVDVATAGMPVAVANQACYCRLNPGAVCAPPCCTVFGEQPLSIPGPSPTRPNGSGS